MRKFPRSISPAHKVKIVVGNGGMHLCNLCIRLSQVCVAPQGILIHYTILEGQRNGSSPKLGRHHKMEEKLVYNSYNSCKSFLEFV